MQVGPRHWRCVDLDAAGVPHGGPYGDVARFDAFCRAEGLVLCWSRVKKCLIVATQKFHQWTVQLSLCKDYGKPVPCNDKLAFLIRWTRRNFGRNSASSIIENLAQAQRDAKREMARLAYERASGSAREGVDRAWNRIHGRKLITVPANYRGGRG